MAIQAYVNFAGNCREALAFYAKAFGAPEPRIMAFGDMPPDPGFPLTPETKDLVMHAELEFAGGKLLFSDTPPGMPLTMGDNISLIVQWKDEADLRRWWDALQGGGKVAMPLGPTFWSKLYGFVTDRFGVGWQFNLED